jgi:hypothetical protein
MPLRWLCAGRCEVPHGKTSSMHGAVLAHSRVKSLRAHCKDMRSATQVYAAWLTLQPPSTSPEVSSLIAHCEPRTIGEATGALQHVIFAVQQIRSVSSEAVAVEVRCPLLGARAVRC